MLAPVKTEQATHTSEKYAQLLTLQIDSECRSRSTGISGHDRPESPVTIDRNTHEVTKPQTQVEILAAFEVEAGRSRLHRHR
jgi:hypothetical protein